MNNYELHSHIHTFNEKGNEKHLQCQLCSMKNPRLTPTKSDWVEGLGDVFDSTFACCLVGCDDKDLHKEHLRLFIQNLLLTQRQELIEILQDEFNELIKLGKGGRFSHDEGWICLQQDLIRTIGFLQSKKQPKND